MSDLLIEVQRVRYCGVIVKLEHMAKGFISHAVPMDNDKRLIKSENVRFDFNYKDFPKEEHIYIYPGSIWEMDVHEYTENGKHKQTFVELPTFIKDKFAAQSLRQWCVRQGISYVTGEHVIDAGEVLY